MIPIKNAEEIEKIRESSVLLVRAFREAEERIAPDFSTESIDRAVESVIRDQGGIPAFKGYRGYPASVCVSIESEVVHGIPGRRKLREGELVSIDIGVVKNGYYSDAAKTYAVGKVSEDRLRLMQITREALDRGIAECREGNHLSDISHAVQTHAESAGFSVVRSLVGHGIGKALHEEPQIPNFGVPGRGPRLLPGMVFAIEPMINMGGFEVTFLDDGWTVRTLDGLPSAHFEHTVLITDSDPKILTRDSETSAG
jgi:methionyl aminopeptidase